MGSVKDYREDECNLCHEVQMHNCNSFCMRCKKGSAKPRYCRVGAGDEATPNKCDTPGFPLRSEPAITQDDRNFLRLEMPRNNLRFHQTPLFVLRGWRGNCDVKILLYRSRVNDPDLQEIAVVSDYLVAYTTKGNETLQVERETLKEFIHPQVSY